MALPAEIVENFMATFVKAWSSKDASSLSAFFSEEAVYHNIPLEPIRGKEAIRTTLESFMGMGGSVEVEVANVVAAGELVVVERVDHFVGADWRSSLPVMGIFEVRQGLITAWRDYFDPSQLAR